MKFSAAVPVLAAVGIASAQNCPPAGTTNAAGDYSCNPAHQYPDGQVCVLKAGCYFLEGTGAKIPSMTSSSMATPTACPAAGTTNAAGEYSCNPAHKYPDGQVCVLKGGCYFLEGTGGKIPSTGGKPITRPTDVVVVAGAPRQAALGGVAAIVGFAAALL